MQEPQPTPTFEPGLDGNDVVTAIFDGIGMALVDWWYVWVLLLLLVFAGAMLNGWADRVAERRKRRR